MALYKRGNIYWTEFELNGQRFRKSLGTSDRRMATRREKQVIADAQAGRMLARARSEEERSAQRGAAARRSHLDKRVKRIVRRENRRHAAERDPGREKARIEAIRTSTRTKESRAERGERSRALWASTQIGPDGLTYRDRNAKALRDGKWGTQKMRGARSRDMKAMCRDSQFIERRNRRSLEAAVERARALGILQTGSGRAASDKGGRPPGVTEKTTWRNRRTAALLRLGSWKGAKNFALVYPDSHDPESAEANARAHLSKHKSAIMAIRNALTEDQARAILAEPVPDFVRSSD